MTPSDYIANILAGYPHGGSKRPEESLCEAVCRLLLSKKFRKYSVGPEYLAHIRTAVETGIARNEPIRLTLVFGGYKLWRLPESPETDWAELFALLYYVQWLRPVCAVYAPGVHLDFFSDDVILEIMDNIPKTDTDAYLSSFRALLDFLRPYLPDNFSVTLTRVADRYDSMEQFMSELRSNMLKLENDPGGFPTMTPEQIRLVELNVKLRPGQAEDPRWRENVFLIHEAYARSSRRRPYYRTPEKIFVSTIRTKDSIAVGTTKNSVVKFWIGAGVLEQTEDGFVPHIYSPNQLEAASFRKQEIRVPGLSGKNYHSIRVFANRSGP